MRWLNRIPTRPTRPGARSGLWPATLLVLALGACHDSQSPSPPPRVPKPKVGAEPHQAQPQPPVRLPQRITEV